MPTTTTTGTTSTPWFKRQRALVEATKSTQPAPKSHSSSTSSTLLDGVEFSSEEATALENDQALLQEAREPTCEEDTLATTTFLDSWIPEVITDKDAGMVAMFNDIWHELESGPVRMMTSEKDDHGMVAMFREVGAAAAAEYHAGRRVLTTATLTQIKWALQQALILWKQSGFLLLKSSSEMFEEKHRNMFLTDTMFEI